MKFIKLSIVILFVNITIHSQTVYLHSSHKVYQFLKRAESKGLLKNYRDAVKPISRNNIALFITTINSQKHLLSQVDKDNLQFYKEEFYQELKNQNLLSVDDSIYLSERWNLYSYKSDGTIVNGNFVGGYTYRDWPFKKLTRTRSNGLITYGYLGSSIGGYLYFRDHQQGGSYQDPNFKFSSEQGQIPIRSTSKNVEYDFADAQLNFDLPYVTLSIEKMNNVWGAGNRGNIILSTKAPSYPQIKISAKLGEKVNFTYIHSSLHSEITDSVNSYLTPYGSSNSIYRKIYRQKYMASHILEFTPITGIDIAIGESNIYGNRNPELLFLLPTMFIKASEHYTVDLDNNQMFGSFDINLIPNYNFYGSLFIDEFSTEEFLREDRQRNQIGFTLGTHIYDLVYENTNILFEYTRLNPWVYNHKFQDATYQSHNFDLGHWVGQNGDLFYTGITYNPIYNLQLTFEYEKIRKGGKKENTFQYQIPTPEFLYSPLLTQSYVGLNVKYEPIRDLIVDFHLRSASYSQEASIPQIESMPRISDDYSSKIDLFLGIRYNYQ
ncbi:MAG: hypothetical protein O3A55_05125 [Bacteroidetes bacterium]|nr:hypothetical protein [Bacteroidota bacterium]